MIYNLTISTKNIGEILSKSEKFKEFFNTDLAENLYSDCPFTGNIEDESLFDDGEMHKIGDNLVFRTSGGVFRFYRKLKDTLHLTNDYIPSFCRSTPRGDLWKGYNQDMTNVSKEGDSKLKNGKKPERLLRDIIYTFTNKNDLVLDAYLGSGTTAAVAHKMGRQYIGIEQLDNHMDMAVKRLQGVIAGEQSGISKSVNWQGGGNFVYCELAKNSQNMIDKITSVPETDLSTLYDEIKASDFICYRVDIDAMDKEKDSFEKLSEIEKRHFLISIIDKNTLYINYADMDDIDYSIDADTKKFNKNFYKEEK